MNRICIIGVYFGNLPEYFNLWLKTCQTNPEIDFLLFTDSVLTELPGNVKCHITTLKDIKKTAAKLLGFPVSLETPYKLCDYKPVYGLLFQSYLSEYDYWGHCDFDMFFGDLMYFFKEYHLDEYDRFNALGHLSLYRNTDEVNHRYQCDGGHYDYKTVFTTDHSCQFDEIHGMTPIYISHGFPFFTKRIFVDVAAQYKRFRIIEGYELDEKAINYPYQIFYWENGKCYRAYIHDKTLHKEEYLYIHFKRRPGIKAQASIHDNDAFYITEFGIFPKTEEVTKETIQKYNPYRGYIFERIEALSFLPIYRCQKILRLIRGKEFRNWLNEYRRLKEIKRTNDSL